MLSRSLHYVPIHAVSHLPVRMVISQKNNISIIVEENKIRKKAKEVGPMLFIIGALATSLPLLLGLVIARYVFKFHPALSLGCTAGARTTTAALGAIQETVGSETPSLGYTVTYAVGNTLLIIWGVVIVLLMN